MVHLIEHGYEVDEMAHEVIISDKSACKNRIEKKFKLFMIQLKKFGIMLIFILLLKFKILLTIFYIYKK